MKATKRRPRSKAPAWHPNKAPAAVIDARIDLLEKLDEKLGELREEGERGFKRLLREDDELRAGHPAPDLLRLRVARNKLIAYSLVDGVVRRGQRQPKALEERARERARKRATELLRRVAHAIGVHKCYLWATIPDARTREGLRTGKLNIRAAPGEKPKSLLQIGMRDLAAYIQRRWPRSRRTGRRSVDRLPAPDLLDRVTRDLRKYEGALGAVFTAKARKQRSVAPDELVRIKQATKLLKRLSRLMDTWLGA